MADDIGLAAQLGIRVAALFAGVCGGIVGAWADQQASLSMWVGYVVCGGLTGNFFAEPAMHIINPIPVFGPYVNEGGAGFIVGACALGIIRGVKELVSRWRPPTIGSAQP
jgi:hypothetical protein